MPFAAVSKNEVVPNGSRPSIWFVAQPMAMRRQAGGWRQSAAARSDEAAVSRTVCATERRYGTTSIVPFVPKGP
jgi:hypothetical protein